MPVDQAKPAHWVVNLRPADIFAIAVPFVFGSIILANAEDVPDWPSIAGSLLGVAIVGFLCRTWASSSSHPVAQLSGNFYCIATIWVAYSRLNPLINLVSPITFDRDLQATDYWLFGVQPSVWLERYHHPWLTELLFICYFAFFFWQLMLGVILYERRNGDFADYFLTVIAFYMLSYVGYVAVPAIGPRFDIAHAYSVPLEGIWVGNSIRDSFMSVPMLRDCFPSGHTGLTLLVLTRAWTKKAYTYFAIMLPFALLLIFSTVYCRFHYVTDLLCALPFIVGILCLDAALRQILPRGVTLNLSRARPRLAALSGRA